MTLTFYAVGSIAIIFLFLVAIYGIYLTFIGVKNLFNKK